MGEGGPDSKVQQTQQQQQLIPGLPDDIAMDCLVRVPHRFHSTIKSVCRGWQTLISHPSFYRQRRKLGTAEHLVCLVQPLPIPSPPPSITDSTNAHYNPLNNNHDNTSTPTNAAEEVHHQEESQLVQKRQLHCPPLYGLTIYNATRHTWNRMMMPNCGASFATGTIPMFCHCVALPSSGKLLLLGGWDPATLEPLPDVYILDFIGGGGFRRAAPMSVARSFFACAAVGPSSVYVAGGHDSQKNALRSAEVYDADADEWLMLPAMVEERDECQGLCWEGDSRFWVVSGYCTESQGRFRSDAECYDPATGSWSTVDGVWPFPSISPRGNTTSIVSSGTEHHYHHCQWWWFLGGEQQQQQSQQQQNREESDVFENKEIKSWKVAVKSIPLPGSMVGLPPCVTALGGIGDGGDRIFVMGGGGGIGSSCSSECDGKGAFLMERDSRGNNKWNHIHTPPNFAGFPYSSSYLLI